jgi:hypothetical protein
MEAVRLVVALLITSIPALTQESNNANAQTPDIALWIAAGVGVIAALILILLKTSGKRDVYPAQQTARETPLPAVEPEYVSALYIPVAEALPPNDQWENRFDIKPALYRGAAQRETVLVLFVPWLEAAPELQTH